MPALSVVQTIAIWVIPVLISITLHEAAHAWVAAKCGDTTAKALGRLSMNPFKHVDPIGTVLIPIIVATLSSFHFIFGWAKPVPIDWRKLKSPKRDIILVAGAGPLLNLILALCFAACIKVGMLYGIKNSMLALFLVLTGQAGVLINLTLGFLNLIPILPLDGGRILLSLLTVKWARYYAQSERFGIIILLLFLFTGVLGRLIMFPMLLMVNLIQFIFNL